MKAMPRAGTVTIRLGLVLAAALYALPAGAADKAYGPGVTDSTITIGQTMPYSGPASVYGTVGRSIAAYFAMINAMGGVNGRKINLISLDDGYSPPKTVEQTRRLVEQDHVLLIFAPLGTATSAATESYLNERKIPQLFVQSGATRWNDPAHFPWSMAGLPSYDSEARAYAHYLLAAKPNARIAVLYQNDDFGKDYLKGLRAGLGARADKMIVATQSYETSDPTIDSQIANLKGSGADTLFSFSLHRQTAQAIRQVYDLGWHPLFVISQIASSVKAVLAPAGLDRAKGLVSAGFLKDATDPRWQNDADFQAWLAWMKQYYPAGSTADLLNAAGYVMAFMMTDVLRRCGDDLSRDNVMRQATHMDHLVLPMVQPGITANTSPVDYRPIKQFQLERFDGRRWVPFGAPVSG